MSPSPTTGLGARPNAGLFTRIVRRLSVWLQPSAPRSFIRFRQRRGWFQSRCATPSKTRDKRQDLVRRLEFDHLRHLRASAQWPPLQAAAGELLAPQAPPTVQERAQTRQKIDAIEAQMSRQTPGATTATPTATAAPGALPGADAGATRIGLAVLGAAEPPRSGS